MILTVTPNPLLEKRLYFDKVKLGSINRSAKETFYAGGKGINVSRQLNKLNVKNSALTLLGGNNGKLLRKTLLEENIEFIAVGIKDETRYCSVIVEEDTKRITSFFAPSSDISVAEVNQFLDKLEKTVQNCSIVVLAGSSPNKEAEQIFLKGIELANHYDKISVIDTYGAHLKECIELSPFCIHNNLNELENSLNISLKNENQIEDFLDYLYSKGIKHSYLTNGGETFYCSKFDFHYKVKPPKINVIDSVGSGDSFTAGIVYGIEKAMVFEDALKLATALGTINTARLDAANVPLPDAEKIIDHVEISSIGKKMKLIDDSPNY